MNIDHASLLLSWQATAFATGPAARDRAEAGIATAYTAAGLTPPEHIIWVPSPAQGAVAAALLAGHAKTLTKDGLKGFKHLSTSAPEESPDPPTDRPAPAKRRFRDLLRPTAESPNANPTHLDEFVRSVSELPAPGKSVRDAVRTRPWEAARKAAHAELGPQEWSRAWSKTGATFWDQVQDLVSRVRQAIGSMAEEDSAAESLLRAATLDAVQGQHDAPWLALFDHLDRLPPGLAEAARDAGWWWPYENLVIVSERPTELHRDEPGRLHRGDGPAMAYPDGFALHAWRGMPIPSDFVSSLDGLDRARIDAEENAELRRVMLEIFGYDRYLAETGARPVHKDETGTLWSITVPGDEPVVMVEVINSTPEPDGTYRTYYLRVPPGTRTAREGVAWTFGLTEADYVPQKET
ncbi:DUF6745 domain-containing protein [Spirillospora sp. CA-294931]|uniref:DUF6745 domain-containing protein n=1 Tax=Spirillospora sp. CA-294931 TaxID=3240042 RepID=UPI003D8A515D